MVVDFLLYLTYVLPKFLHEKTKNKATDLPLTNLPAAERNIEIILLIMFAVHDFNKIARIFVSKLIWYFFPKLPFGLYTKNKNKFLEPTLFPKKVSRKQRRILPLH